MIKINIFKRFLPGILILSILINYYFITAFYQSNKYDKSQAVLSISAYADHLRTFTEYVDLFLDNPDDIQSLRVLMDQSDEIKAILNGGNYYSFKHMSKLFTCLNLVTKQVNDAAYICKAGTASKEQVDDLKYINNNLKEIVRYFDEIKSDILSNKLQNDYLVKNQFEISNKLNQKLELNNAKLLKYVNQ
ncbi:MAG: hypothetical protein K0R84_215 [Clostridia bacterium]|nr:hypothetical protein [Clostridia bacterium]